MFFSNLQAARQRFIGLWVEGLRVKGLRVKGLGFRVGFVNGLIGFGGSRDAVGLRARGLIWFRGDSGLKV